MRKIYISLAIVSFLFFTGCSKDFLKPYDDRIVGTWQIEDVNKIGFGGSVNDLPFRDGSFRFNRDGALVYTTTSGSVFNGTWDIQKKTVNRSDGSDVYHSLQITAVNFTTQQVLGEYYDDINFTGTNHIKARIILGTRTYVTHLSR